MVLSEETINTKKVKNIQIFFQLFVFGICLPSFVFVILRIRTRVFEGKDFSLRVSGVFTTDEKVGRPRSFPQDYFLQWCTQQADIFSFLSKYSFFLRVPQVFFVFFSCCGVGHKIIPVCFREGDRDGIKKDLFVVKGGWG